ncbi:MAG: tetratricopeptide repeat protein, partial [Bacteroidales bacterium]|nr:tetratricopeptide repeat protein [Bacteroidales bacterium]
AKAWDKVTKGSGVAAPEVKSAGEDWEGFQKLVSESDLEDKDLILRVLSMYSDPAVRENEIKNMSEVYTALKGEVLPELRRARLIAKIEYQNLSNEELQKALEENGDLLDEDSYLRLGSLAKTPAAKEDIYKKGIDKLGVPGAKRCVYNLASTLLNEGKTAEAEKWIKQLDAADAASLKGVVALQKGDLETARSAFALARTEQEKANLGTVLILSGEYEDAARLLAGVKDSRFNSALAYILNNQLDEAEKLLASCPEEGCCGKCAYLKAIIAARRGDSSAVRDNLARAFDKDASLKERAAKDVEFAGYEF